MDAFERGNCSSQRATELIQNVTNAKNEVIESNLTGPKRLNIKTVIPASFQIMDKLDKCHKERTQLNGPGEPKLENQKVKAIQYALLEVAIQKVRLDNQILADELEFSVTELKDKDIFIDVVDEIGYGTCSRQEFFNTIQNCIDYGGPKSKELKRMGKNGDPCPSLDFIFSCTDKCYTEQEKNRFIPFYWKIMTLYVKGDKGGIPGNKEISAKMGTCKSAILGCEICRSGPN